MIFQQILNEESGCLSYLIGCSEAGRALIVDPGRDRVHEYLRLAAKKGLTISHIVETHTHADHISGNRDLAELTRAPILVHRAAGVAFEHSEVSDGDELRIGSVRVQIAHTPGHTADSICLLVTDLSRGDIPWFVLTGDMLFVGSVGRPDLGGAQAAPDRHAGERCRRSPDRPSASSGASTRRSSSRSAARSSTSSCATFRPSRR